MVEKTKELMSDRVVLISATIVFVVLLVILATVFSHEKEKPKSPQHLVAAAFNQTLPVKEWKPGMGAQPFMYHPAAFNPVVQEWKPGMGTQPFVYHPAAAGQPTWQPLPPRAGLRR
jgi:hypothetical protein